MRYTLVGADSLVVDAAAVAAVIVPGDTCWDFRRLPLRLPLLTPSAPPSPSLVTLP